MIFGVAESLVHADDLYYSPLLALGAALFALALGLTLHRAQSQD